MAASLVGKIAIWGAGGVTVSGIIADANGQLQSVDFTRTADSANLDNSVGETVGQAYYNDHFDVTLSVIPAGTDAIAAKANLDALLPAPGTAVSIVDADSVITDSSAKFTVQSARVNRTNKGFATVDLTLRRYASLVIA